MPRARDFGRMYSGLGKKIIRPLRATGMECILAGQRKHNHTVATNPLKLLGTLGSRHLLVAGDAKALWTEERRSLCGTIGFP